MGCGPSVHPSILDETNKGVKQPLKKNAVDVVDANSNKATIKGDYSQFQAAKYIRNMQRKDRQLKIFAAANEMSGRLMEEREMLSLGTRSRGTSVGTSRAGSPPVNNKRSSPMKTEDHVAPMTPVTENDIASRGSDRRDGGGLANGQIPVDVEVNVADIEDTTAGVEPKSQKKKRKTKTKAKATKAKKHKKHKKHRKDVEVNENEVSDSDNDLDMQGAANYVALNHTQSEVHEPMNSPDLDTGRRSHHGEDTGDTGVVNVTQVGSGADNKPDIHKEHRGNGIISENSISIAAASPDMTN